MRALVVTTALLLAPALAHAETIYVDDGVSSDCTDYDPDARACGSGSARAFHRIQSSFAAASPGDTVVIRGGTYTEEQAYGPFPPSGADGAPIVFRGADGEDVHIEGDMNPHSSSGVGSPFRLYGVDCVQISNLEISGFFQGIDLGGSDSTQSGPARHIVLEDLRIHDCGLGIYVRMGSSDIAIRDVQATANYLTDDGGAGLMIRDGSDIHVERMIAEANDDGRGIDGDGDGFHIEPGLRIELVDCVARDNSEDGYDLTGDDIRIERSIAERSGAVGFKLWDEHASDHPEVNDYLVVSSISHHNGEAGLFAANGPNARIYGSVFYGNGAEGVRFTRGLDNFPESDPPSAEMLNDIVAGNARWGRRFGDGGGSDDEGWIFTSDHDLFFGNGTDDAWGGEGEGTLARDPMFAGAEGGDFHLLDGSPAIDAGRALGAEHAFAIDGVARPMGGGWDIGAYEHLVPLPDAGAAIDAGTSIDASTADASTADASTADASTADASTAGGDAGAAIDGGPTTIAGGCGCRAATTRSSTTPAFLLLALALVLDARRRKR